MMKRLVLALCLGIAGHASALVPAPGFKVKSTLGEVTSYELAGKDIEINSLSSEFKYDDLTEKEMGEMKKLFEAKQEYGKMFGFAGWTPTGQKLLEKNGERIVLVQGHYKDAQNKKVNFIEVYWASKEKAGQYLITSDTVVLKMDNFSEYLK